LKQVAVIILNWNRSQQTIELIDNYLEVEKNISICFIVVDNNSKDSERNILLDFSMKNGFEVLEEDEIGTAHLDLNHNKFTIALNENYGYAKGNNFGLKLAKKLGYEYSLVSNNDIIIEKPLIETLIQKLESEKDLALIGPKIVGLEGEQQGPYKKPTLFDQFWVPFFMPLFIIINKLLVNRISKMLIEVDNPYPYRVMGCFMLIKTDVMEEVGYFDENTFLYAEELILSEKFIAKGYKTGYYHHASIKHLHGFSTEDLGNKRKFLLNLESDIYYFKEYRDYGTIKVFLVRLGRKAAFYIWNPFILKLKKSLSKNPS
jgi:GT2 family glycosyltransferase